MCDANAECRNEVGTYSCQCSVGFEGDGVECVDINECDDNTHGCHGDAQCFNTLGTYACECDPGYVGNGFNCSDILDCDQNPHICGPHGTCINSQGVHIKFKIAVKVSYLAKIKTKKWCGHHRNSPGDYSCECDVGYTPTYNGKECEDINECKGDLTVCAHGNCVNMDGTYACQCHAGYQLNDAGDQCEDIDECHTEDENAMICLAQRLKYFD